MYSEFEHIFKTLFLKRDLEISCNEGDSDSIDRKTYVNVYRKILDKVAIRLIYECIENERYITAMLRLAKMERIILVFNILLGMELAEIAYLLETSMDSTYTQKNTALQRLKDELSQVD